MVIIKFLKTPIHYSTWLDWSYMLPVITRPIFWLTGTYIPKKKSSHRVVTLIIIKERSKENHSHLENTIIAIILMKTPVHHLIRLDWSYRLQVLAFQILQLILYIHLGSPWVYVPPQKKEIINFHRVVILILRQNNQSKPLRFKKCVSGTTLLMTLGYDMIHIFGLLLNV